MIAARHKLGREAPTAWRGRGMCGWETAMRSRISRGGVTLLERRWCWPRAAGKEERKAAAPPVTDVGVITVTLRDVLLNFEFVGETRGSQQVEIRARVNGFLDQRALRVGALLQEAVHAGPDLHLLGTLRLAHELEVQRHVTQRHGDHADVGHRWRRGLALLLPAARAQHQYGAASSVTPSADPAAHCGLPSTCYAHAMQRALLDSACAAPQSMAIGPRATPRQGPGGGIRASSWDALNGLRR